MEYLQRAIEEFKHIVEVITSVMEPAVQERAFGAPGVTGDPERIRHLARRWISNYEAMLDWAAHIRGTSHPTDFDQVFNLLASWANGPIHEFRVFVGELLAQMDRIPGALLAGEKVSITLTLAIILDDKITSPLTEELDRLRVRIAAHKNGPGSAASGHSGTTLLPRNYQSQQPQPDLERRFHQLMKDLYQETGRRSTAIGMPYWSNYFNRSVTLRGGLEAARRYLARRDPQNGFQRMIDLGLADISLEAVVLKHPWMALFTSQELATARRRLQNAGLSHLTPPDA